MAMQSLERTLERMVTGVFSRGSRSHIRPIELGRRLVREMDDQRSVDVKGRRVVPNDFTVRLSQQDFDSFNDIKAVLATELVEAAREYARAEGYHFMGPVRVELKVDEEAKPGRFEVDAILKQAPGAAAASSPEKSSSPGASAPVPGAAPAGAAPVAPSVPAPTAPAGPEVDPLFAPPPATTDLTCSLVLPSGQPLRLDESTVTIGRLSESTIPINDQNVSRRHAEVLPKGKHYVIVDLGSTNGTLVNGSRINGEHVLSDGDIISFGSTYVRFEAS